MLCRKAEILVYLKLAGSLSAADEQLLDLVHPLAEAALESYMQQELEYKRHIEYLPVGQPLLASEFQLEDLSFRKAGGGVVLRSNRPGTDFLQLKHAPVTTFGLEVREDLDAKAGQEDAAFPASTVLTMGDDYYLDADERKMVEGHSVHLSRSGVLRRLGAWPVEPRTVKVTYYGGWQADQLYGRAAGAVRLAAIKTVAAFFWEARSNADSKGRGPKMSESIGKYSYSVGQAAIARMSGGVPGDAIELLQPFRSYRYL